MSDGWAIAGSIAGIVGAVVAVLGAVVSVVKAWKARRSQKDAEEAKKQTMDLTLRMVEAMETQAALQSRILDVSTSATKQPVWSGLRRVSGQLSALRNMGADNVHVSALSVVPEAAAESRG